MLTSPLLWMNAYDAKFFATCARRVVAVRVDERLHAPNRLVPWHATQIALELVMPARLVIRQAEEGNPQADQHRQQQHDHDRDHGWYTPNMAVVLRSAQRLKTNSEAQCRQAKADHGAGRDD